MRHLFALLLLASFGLGFVAGPHPCKGMLGESPAQVSGHASCHAAAPAEKAAQKAPLHHSGTTPDCCNTLCEHACHSVAIASVRPVTFAVGPLSDSAIEVSAPAFSPFAFAIDHVPLA